MRVVIKRSGGLKAPFRIGWLLVAFCGLLFVGGASVFTFYYVRYSRLIDELLQGSVFPNVSQIYAAPERVKVGDRSSVPDLISHLRQAGFTERTENPRGYYQPLADGLRILPGKDSYFAPDPAEIRLADGAVSSIVSLRDQMARSEYSLEPALVTNLFDRTREKRRVVLFQDLPPVLVNAILAIEDRRFFQHSGVDYLRMLKAAYVDIRSRRTQQGASTLTMQLARSFFLTPQRTFKRKLEETLVAFQLEHRLNKQQIFEFYVNRVPMGRRGSFNIEGIGEASQAYFGKDFRELSLPEAATLAGLIQRPSALNPFRNPERCRERRNVVLKTMLENDFTNRAQYEQAVKAPLSVAPLAAESGDAPYFVDLVNEQLQAHISEKELLTQVYRVYTTLDLNLQRAAVEAVRFGMPLVDELIKRQRRFRGKTPPTPQCVLIALDPHTGEVKALLGGRNYGVSQLNRAVAKRQPGSAFKPFVYAAAMNSALDHAGAVLTPISHVEDAPTTFWFDGKPYDPSNFKHEFHGQTTLRLALAKSMNVATIKVAEMVGYDKVVELAHAAGMNEQIQATPSVAIGAYDVQPIEVAGAYTVFANNGVFVQPTMLRTVREIGRAHV